MYRQAVQHHKTYKNITEITSAELGFLRTHPNIKSNVKQNTCIRVGKSIKNVSL